MFEAEARTANCEPAISRHNDLKRHSSNKVVQRPPANHRKGNTLRQAELAEDFKNHRGNSYVG